jgi:hypothetical protein
MASTSPIIYTTYGAKHANAPHVESIGATMNQPKKSRRTSYRIPRFLPHPIMQRAQIALAQGAKYQGAK